MRTFYFPDTDTEGRAMLLRTHTSPVQIRTMTSNPPPIRIIAGPRLSLWTRTRRTPDVPPDRGLVIDKGIHLGHLKWTLETF